MAKILSGELTSLGELVGLEGLAVPREASQGEQEGLEGPEDSQEGQEGPRKAGPGPMMEHSRPA
jgi:hypothetical protein